MLACRHSDILDACVKKDLKLRNLSIFICDVTVQEYCKREENLTLIGIFYYSIILQTREICIR